MPSTTATWVEMLGPVLRTPGKDGKDVNTAEALDKDVIALYFSAHWCPPCRQFTPVLCQYYKDMKAKGKSFEMVFISSDRDQSAFDEYHGFDWREVSGIPALFFLDREGTIITDQGRSAVSADPEGLIFPYKPLTIYKVLSCLEPLIDCATGNPVGRDRLDDKTVLLYFTTLEEHEKDGKALEEVHRVLTTGKKDVEVVLIDSGEKKVEEDEFKNSVKGLPFLALHPSAKEGKVAASMFFEVRGQSLVVLGPDQVVINKDALKQDTQDTTAKDFPYYPQAMVEYGESFSSGGYRLGEKPVFFLMMEDCEEAERAHLKSLLHSVATEHVAKARSVCVGDTCTMPDPEAPYCIFFTVSKSAESVEGLKRFADYQTKENGILLLDVRKRAKYQYTGKIDEEVLRKTVDDFAKGKLELKSL
ncbi:hypothetical protein HK101_011855 [Irineochytrium annulatum]|nr:hypothetical protein HK101_011855 [Irineochytrium annulatum]